MSTPLNIGTVERAFFPAEPPRNLIALLIAAYEEAGLPAEFARAAAQADFDCSFRALAQAA